MEFLPLIGGLVNNLFAGFRQEQGQDFATAQAAQAYAYMRAGRRTAYQDTMYSMREAGLNPILAYKQGAVSGTMGTTPSPVSAATPDIGLGATATTALAARRQDQELKNMVATEKLTNMQAEKTQAERDTELNRPENVKASTQQIQAQTGYTFQQLQKGLAEAMQATSLADWIASNPRLAQAMVVAAWGGGKVGEVLAPFGDAVKGLLAGGKNSAPSTNRRGPIPPGHSSRNLSDQDMLLTPNSYKRSQPGWQAAPPPGGGWFTDRWNAMNQP